MSAVVIEFRKAEGPLTQMDTIKVETKKQFAERFQRAMSDDLAEKIARAIMEAPPKRGG